MALANISHAWQSEDYTSGTVMAWQSLFVRVVMPCATAWQRSVPCVTFAFAMEKSRGATPKTPCESEVINGLYCIWDLKISLNQCSPHPASVKKKNKLVEVITIKILTQGRGYI